MSNPPILQSVLSRGRPGGLLTPRCRYRKPLPKRRTICARFAIAFAVAYSLRNAHGTRCTFGTDSAADALDRIGHHMISVELCSGLVKALAALDPAGFGLDDACAQLEGSTYVMAEEARPQFCVDPAHRQSYREDLVGAIAHPSAVPPDAERCKRTLSEQGYQHLQQSIV